VQFDQLPTNVTWLNPTGVKEGVPYLNLSPLLPAGGLGRGASSAPVEVQFRNLDLTQFNLTPRIWVGPGNQAPVVAAQTSVTLTPGAYFEQQLNASDPDGDALTYRLTTTAQSPPVTLTSDGTLIFRPSPTHLNQTYQFFVHVSDGGLETTQTVTLTVAPDPNTSTRISGVIRDGSQAQSPPLGGVVVAWGGSQAVTAADGSFELVLPTSLPTGLLTIDGTPTHLPSFNYLDVTADVTTLLGHGLYVGANNVIPTPIYLTSATSSTTVSVNPNGPTVVSDGAGVSFSIPAGSLKTADGSAYLGSVSVIQVSPERLSVPLPEDVTTNDIIQIEMGEAVCEEPVPLTMPNTTSYQGVMDLYRLNPNSGKWEIVGSGNASGTTITWLSGGIGAQLDGSGSFGSGAYFYAPRPFVAKALDEITRNPDEVCESCKVRKHFNADSTVELHSGAVMESHDLISYQSLGETRGLRLQYDSLRADPRPIVHFGYDDVPDNPDYRMIAKLSVKIGESVYQVPGYQGNAYRLTGGEHFWRIPPGGGDIDGALQVDMRSFETGIYEYDLTTGIKVLCECDYFVGQSTTRRDQLIVVNSTNSVFGSGWGLVGWQEIVEANNQVLLIDGDGSQLLFKGSNGSYQSSAGDFSKLEKVNGTFKRTLKDGTVYRFNAQNKLEDVRDRNGNRTQYVYDATGTRLQQIIDPAQLVTQLEYNGAGKVWKIIDPANRTTVLEYDAAGNLQRVSDPNGQYRTWGYDAEHHLVSEIDRRGFREQSFYDFAGRATHSINRDGSVVRVSPVQVQGLYRANETIDPINAPDAFLEKPAEADYIDGNGKVTRVRLDRSQQDIFSTDGVGTSGTSTYGDTRPSHQYLATSTINARGYETRYTYDERGNVIRIDEKLAQGTSATDTLFANPIYSGDSRSVAVDWNGDGHVDLVSATQVVYGNGKGDFSVPMRLNTQAGELLGVEDVNGDGRFDLVTLPGHGQPVVHLRQADGTLQAQSPLTSTSTYTQYRTGGLADLDGDGDLDLFSVKGLDRGYDPTPGSSDLEVWRNSGNGLFAAAPLRVQMAGDFVQLAVGSLNPDNALDFVMQTNLGTVSLLGQLSAGALEGYQATTLSRPTGAFTLEDVNGDGQSEWVIAQPDEGRITVLSSNGDGTFGASILTLSAGPFFAPTSLQFMDMNGDGKRDLVANSNGIIDVWHRATNGTDFLAVQRYATGIDSDNWLLANFNSAVDGAGPAITDFLVPYDGALLINQGNGTVERRLSNPDLARYETISAPIAVLTSDLNQDGVLDVITANAQQVSVRLGIGDGTLAPRVDYEVAGGLQAISLGDINQDGWADVVTVNAAGQLMVGLGKGQGRLADLVATGDSVSGSTVTMKLADINQDGRLDLIRATANSHQISVLLGHGDGTFGSATSFNTSNSHFETFVLKSEPLKACALNFMNGRMGIPAIDSCSK